MANARIKTEMKGTGGGRWCPRAEAKKASKKARRTNDKKAQREDFTKIALKGPRPSAKLVKQIGRLGQLD